MLIDLFPTKCNICGGKVIYTSNAMIYRKEYGSGRMYYCTNCGSYVGTHKPRPKEAMGILANADMREMKKQCHSLFDNKWINQPTARKKYIARQKAYKDLAEKLNISIVDCHFGHFDMDMLNKAYAVLRGEIYESPY